MSRVYLSLVDASQDRDGHQADLEQGRETAHTANQIWKETAAGAGGTGGSGRGKAGWCLGEKLGATISSTLT